MTTGQWLRKTIIGATCLTVLLTAAPADSFTGIQSVSAATASAEVKASSQKANRVVASARSLIGKVRYKFGVNNARTLTFDCSSFTKYVFGAHGVSLKWGSFAQSKQGKYVAKKNLKKGDLVFFSVSNPGKINHVGIYIGSGKFIHNTTGSAKGVIISDMNSSSYSKRYITARRVL